MKSIMPYISPGMKDRCIVCGAFAANYFASVGGRIYRRCDACQATFLDPAQRVPPDEEYTRYCQHRNDPEDEGYRRFLSKLADPLLTRLAPGAGGLDYGCGPGPVLSGMLREAGHRMRLFDPFFSPDPEPLDGLYDFITCTETIEHFHQPAEEFARFNWMLRPGGWLAVMTCFLTDDVHFASWRYRRDRPQRLDQYRLLPGDGYEDDPDWFNAFARERIGGAIMQGAPYQTKPRTTGRNRFLLTSTLNV